VNAGAVLPFHTAISLTVFQVLHLKTMLDEIVLYAFSSANKQAQIIKLVPCFPYKEFETCKCSEIQRSMCENLTKESEVLQSCCNNNKKHNYPQRKRTSNIAVQKAFQL